VSLLNDDRVREALRRAWLDSRPGSPAAHEEGGFILRSSDGSIHVERWPEGLQDTIAVPSHGGGMYKGMTIVGSFHTRPNFSPEFLPYPSPTDIRAVRDDPDLRSVEYQGEFVISQELIYRILNTGTAFEIVGPTDELLGRGDSAENEDESAT
jgi:hypothetical protein